jgi:hypothetical protein
MRLLLKRKEDMVALLALFQAIFVQVACGVHLNPDLLAFTAGLNIQPAVAGLDGKRRGAAQRIGLLPVVPGQLSGSGQGCKRKGRRGSKGNAGGREGQTVRPDGHGLSPGRQYAAGEGLVPGIL